MIALQRLKELLDQFPKLKIGVVGDLFLDRYLEIDAALEEISVETGLAAHQVKAIRNFPGVVGTVLNNLLALGVTDLLPVSVIGDDGHGYDLLNVLSQQGVDTSAILRAAGRLTPTYTKPMRSYGDSLTELSRLDVRTRAPFSESLTQELFTIFAKHWPERNGWIVLDQLAATEARVVNDRFRTLAADLIRTDLEGRAASHPVFVDSRFNIAQFPFGILKTNASECLASCGLEPTDDLGVIASCVEKRSNQSSHVVVCTVGPLGMLLAEPGKKVLHAPGFPVSGPVDIVGAGDSATSGMFAAMLAGADLLEAATVGNLVASITIQQIGTTGVATPDQLLMRWQETLGRRQ